MIEQLFLSPRALLGLSVNKSVNLQAQLQGSAGVTPSSLQQLLFIVHQ